jgi:hypothetical protein
MTKKERVKRIRTMLYSLHLENEFGGFNEFSHFCEEWLNENLHYLSTEGLNKLIKDIEEASCLGITVRKPFGSMDL